MNKKLILFDIDGILIGGKNEAHRQSFSMAIKEVFNINAKIDEIQPSGKTDTRIIIELLYKKGIPVEKVRPKLKEIYKIMTAYVKKHISESNIIATKGIKELLEKLKKKGYVLGLLTGNLKDIAKIKLKMVGLLKFFQVGGFGEISEVREKLIEQAIKETEKKFDMKINKKNVVYVGDAPLDIICGKNVGIKTIAIATGSHSREELSKYNPNYLFDDFSNLNSIIAAIES